MFVRIEVAMKPEYSDPIAQSLLKRVHAQAPELRKKIRWARLIDVYWLDVPRSREDIIPACQEIFQERVTQWLFTGNLIPSASGKQGGLEDLMEASPVRPGKFWGVERRLRTGLTDSKAQAALEALRVVLASDLIGASTSTGQLLLLEGAQLNEADLSQLAREVWCNEISETWTILPEHELISNDRFHQEKKHREDVPRFDGAAHLSKPSLQSFAKKLNSPRLSMSPMGEAAKPDKAFSLRNGTPEQWLEYSKLRGWDWTQEHWQILNDYWARTQCAREPSDLELAVIAACWSESARGRLWLNEFAAEDGSRSYFNLFAETLGATVLQQPKPWVVSSDDSRPAVLALSEDLWISWSARVSSDAALRDPYSETLNVILGVQRDLLGADCLSLPILQSQTCEGDPIQKGVIRRASELASNRTQVPMLAGADMGGVSGAMVQPVLISAGLASVLGRERGHVRPGDRMGWIATGVTGPAALEDPVSQRKLMDALHEAQLRDLLAAVRSSGALPAVWGAIQLAREGGGLAIALPVQQLGDFLSKRESLVLAVRPDRWNELKALLDSWGVHLTSCGVFESTGKIRLQAEGLSQVGLDLDFLWDSAPRRRVTFSVGEVREALPEPSHPPFKNSGDQLLKEILSLDQVRSPERILQSFDLEAQAHTILKPLHAVAASEGDWMQGPNDGPVVLVPDRDPSGSATVGASVSLQTEQPMVAVAIGGISRRRGASSQWLAWMAVDEALRNLVCTGAQVGVEDSLCALSIQWRGESPDKHPGTAQELVETLEAVKEASISMGLPVVTAAASFSQRPQSGLLVCQSLGRLKAVRWARSADFKAPSDAIYVLGPESHSLAGSLFAEHFGASGAAEFARPQWAMARRLYGWLSGGVGKEQGRIRSLHDVSDGGLLVAISEGMVARGLGAIVRMPEDALPEAWAFGEGFHRLVLTCSEADSAILESEWSHLSIPFQRLGSVTASGRLEVQGAWSVAVADLRKAWRAEEVYT